MKSNRKSVFITYEQSKAATKNAYHVWILYTAMQLTWFITTIASQHATVNTFKVFAVATVIGALYTIFHRWFIKAALSRFWTCEIVFLADRDQSEIEINITSNPINQTTICSTTVETSKMSKNINSGKSQRYEG